MSLNKRNSSSGFCISYVWLDLQTFNVSQMLKTVDRCLENVMDGRIINLASHTYKPWGRWNTNGSKYRLSKLSRAEGRAMAQAVSRRHLTLEALVSIAGQSVWDLWWKKWHWNRVFPKSWGFPLSISYHRCSFTRKNDRKLIIFVKGLHSKRQGCGVSGGSAAGPFTPPPHTPPPPTKVELKQSQLRPSSEGCRYQYRLSGCDTV
jgi:hypothetical protein